MQEEKRTEVEKSDEGFQQLFRKPSRRRRGDRFIRTERNQKKRNREIREEGKRRGKEGKGRGREAGRQAREVAGGQETGRERGGRIFQN